MHDNYRQTIINDKHEFQTKDLENLTATRTQAEEEYKSNNVFKYYKNKS